MAITLEDEKRINKQKGLEIHRNAQNGFVVMRIHYTADPEKDNKDWIEKTKNTIGTQGWEREYEINFDSVAGTPVYGDFNRDVHVAQVQPRRDLPIIRCWDWGYGHPACVWMQVLEKNRVIVFDELMGTNINIQPFVDQVEERWKDWGNSIYGRNIEDYGDPAGNMNSDKSEYTTIQLLRLRGINVRSKASGIMNGVNFIRWLFYQRDDNGNPMIKIHPRCNILIAGFSGKYAMADTEVVAGIKQELPVKDGYYDHLQDAFRYGIVNKFNVLSYGSTDDDEDNHNIKHQHYRSKLFGY